MTAHDNTLNEARKIDSSTPLSEEAVDPITEPLDPTVQRLPSAQESSTVESVRSFVRDNPGPALLIGAGLAWLFVNRERERTRSLPTRLKARASSVRESTRASYTEAKTSTTLKLENAREATGEKIESAKLAARERGHAVKERYHTMLDQNPLALGAVAMACGLAVGLLIPPSQRENELLGEASDSLMEQARQIVNDAREAAVSTLRAKKEDVQGKLLEAKEEAEGAVRESADEAKQTFRNEVRSEKSEPYNTYEREDDDYNE